MTDQQERGLVFLVAAGLLIGGVVLLWPTSKPSSARWSRPIILADVQVVVPALVVPKKTNVNTADALELTELPGIGGALAARILAYRAEHGPFRTLDDLVAVRGIGPATVDGLREAATTGDASKTTAPDEGGWQPLERKEEASRRPPWSIEEGVR